MATSASLEERLAAVEAAIAELQKQITSSPQTNWLQQITGSFQDEPAKVTAIFQDVWHSTRHWTLPSQGLMLEDWTVSF